MAALPAAEGRSKRAIMESEVLYEVMRIALQHPAVTAVMEDPVVLCNTLQTCRSWRSALQQSTSCCTIIDVEIIESLYNILKFASFIAWVPKHAGLLAEIRLPAEQKSLSALYQAGLELSPYEYCSAVTNMLVPAVQSPMLRLKGFTTQSVQHSTVGLLEVLPTAKLTRIELGSNSREYFDEFCGSVRAAQALNGWLFAASSVILSHCSQLASLTRLSFDGWLLGESDFSALPSQLVDLSVGVGNERPVVSLRHLTALRELRLAVQDAPASESCLPEGLTSLVVEIDDDACDKPVLKELGIMQLHCLRRLALIGFLDRSEDLQQLTVLGQLTHLHLHYTYENNWEVPATAPGWSLLPPLRSLSIKFALQEIQDGLDAEETEQLFSNLGAATTLTSLCISGDFRSEEFGEADRRSMCKHLTGLRLLQELVWTAGLDLWAELEDLCNLTSLTGLTRLVVRSPSGVDDVVLAGIASWLKQLQHLELWDCELGSRAVLPMIGSLTGLTHLTIIQREGSVNMLRDADIRLLTMLTGLKQLDFGECFSKAALASFWSAINAARTG